MDIYTSSILISIVIYALGGTLRTVGHHGLQDDRPFLLEQAAILKFPLRNSGGRGPRRSRTARWVIGHLHPKSSHLESAPLDPAGTPTFRLDPFERAGAGHVD
jgi:hypothetical protein